MPVTIRFDKEFGEKLVPLSEVEGKLHKFASETPWMDDKDFQGFKADIALNGQLNAITLYRGLIVDGRHRVKALKELGKTEVLCKQMHYQSTEVEIAQAVDSYENRRHETNTQLAIRGYKMTKRTVNKKTQDQAALEVGVSDKQIKAVSTIAKYRPNLVEELFAGKAFQYMDNGRQKTTTSVQLIAKIVKKQDTTANATEASQLSEESQAKVNVMVDTVKTVIDNLSKTMNQAELKAAFSELALATSSEHIRMEAEITKLIEVMSYGSTGGASVSVLQDYLEANFSSIDPSELDAFIESRKGILWKVENGLVTMPTIKQKESE